MFRGLAFASIVLGSCGGFHGPTAESAVIRRVFESSRGDVGSRMPRIATDGAAITGWTVPTTLEDLPLRVRRTAEFVQPGGEIHFVGRSVAGATGQDGDERFVIESTYPEAPWFRRLELDREGNVLSRSHGIELAAAPAAVRERMQTFGIGSRIEFVQNAAGDRYRGGIAAPEGATRYLEFTAEGAAVREWLVTTVRVRG